MKHINYEKLMTQTYLTSPLFSNSETKLLFALRTRTVEEIRANFGIMNGGNQNCPINCWSQAELKKHGNMGNTFPEPMSVFRNQVSRQGRYIQEYLKLLRNNSKRDGS